MLFHLDISQVVRTTLWVHLMSSSMNSSNFTHHFNDTFRTPAQTDLLIFAVYKMILSPLTVLGNGLLVLTGCVDPLRSFRTPSSLFLLTMSTANVFTGAIVAPIFASLEYHSFFGRNHLLNLAKVGSSFSLLTLNISFGMVFALAVDCFIAVFRPTKYRTWITMGRAKIFIAVISAIALTFAILPHLSVPFETVFKVDLHFNSTLNSALLVASYLLLYIAFQNQTKKSLNLRRAGNNQRTNTAEVDKIFALQNKFRRVLLIFVIFSTVPAILSTIAYHFELYCAPCKKYKSIVIVQKVFLNLMFMKCAMDPFAFGWRLSRNRQALKKIIFCQLRVVRPMGNTADHPENLLRETRF